MNGAHWSEQDLINHVYGIAPAADHLDACAECRARAAELSARRTQAAQPPEVSSEFLAAQRRSIYRKLGREPRRRFHAMPAFAAALVLLVATLLFRPHPDAPPPLVTSAADSKLFSDLYAIEENPEPQAVQTMQSLFEEN